jgi:hypothetical protein
MERVTKGKARHRWQGTEPNRDQTNLHVPMSLEIKHSKTADESQRVHMDSEFSEEIYNRRCAVRKGKPQDERGQYDRKQFLGVDHDLHREQFAKFLVYLQCMIREDVNVTSQIAKNHNVLA